MFIKLHWVYTDDPVVFNTEHIIRIDRGGGWTLVTTTDGKQHRVRETPDDILRFLDIKR